MPARKIITTHVYPPIPSRSWDYSAHFDGDEEIGPVGWGPTVTDALEDLHMAVDIRDYPEPEQSERMDALRAFVKAGA